MREPSTQNIQIMLTFLPFFQQINENFSVFFDVVKQ